jgi:hypothetical protein
MLEHKCTSTKQLLWSGGTGLLGGIVAGPFSNVTPFNPNSPWLDQSAVKALNNNATIEELLGAGNFIRSGASGFSSNFPTLF